MQQMSEATHAMHKALTCLYIATDAHVADDVNAKVRARVVELEEALRAAKSAIWELHNWKTAADFDADPAVKAIDAVLSYPRAT